MSPQRHRWYLPRRYQRRGVRAHRLLEAVVAGSPLQSPLPRPPGDGSGSAVVRPSVLVDELIADRERHAEAYARATPWPHLVVDGAVDAATAAAAEDEIAEQAARLRTHRSRRQVKAETGEVTGMAARAILGDLAAPAFLEFLTGLTGIDGLVADPSHRWAGLHAYGPGAFHAVHADFDRHPVTDLYHRVNVLVYLNSAWSPSWNGDLELWSPDMRSCGARVAPTIGRMAVFAVDATTLHGIPDRIACPPGRTRLSLASYYYSAVPPSAAPRRLDRIRRPRRPGDPWWAAVPPARDLGGGILHSVRNRRRLGHW